MSAREEVLQRVGTALASGQRGVVVPREYQQATGQPGEVHVLVERLEDYRAGVHRAAPSTLADVVASLLSGSATVVVPAGLPRAWVTGVPGSTAQLDGDGLSPAELDEVDAVLTGCCLAIAETGTIVLDHGPGMGRRALTLVPDHHVVVVFEDQVVPGLPDAVAVLDPARPMTWISGPSATSDIELNRVEGVHGPRRLDVVLVAVDG